MTKPKTKRPNPIEVYVGSRVRMRRLMLNLSQEKLGKALGITVCADGLASTSGNIVTQIQLDSSRADSAVRVRYAQPRSRPSLPASLASARFLPSPVGSDKMRNFLAEYPAWFEPDEVQILVAAFDKAWETVQASVVIYPEAKAEAARAILAKHIIEAAKQGERDHTRLRDGALLALAQSNLRNSPPPPPR